jgi:hypothetical protein
MCCGVILQDIIRAFCYCNKIAYDSDILITFCYFMDTRAIIIKAGLDPFNVINRRNFNYFLLILVSEVILSLKRQSQFRTNISLS